MTTDDSAGRMDQGTDEAILEAAAAGGDFTRIPKLNKLKITKVYLMAYYNLRK